MIKERILRRFQLVLCLLLVVVMASGCETLRKKFTRKKKEDKKEKFIPVLDPIDYPKALESPEEQYGFHYSMRAVWQNNLMDALNEKNDNPKRIQNFWEQTKTQMNAMSDWLSPEKKAEFHVLLEEAEALSREFDKPAVMRENALLRNKLMALDKKIRRNFNLKEMEGHLTHSL